MAFIFCKIRNPKIKRVKLGTFCVSDVYIRIKSVRAAAAEHGISLGAVCEDVATLTDVHRTKCNYECSGKAAWWLEGQTADVTSYLFTVLLTLRCLLPPPRLSCYHVLQFAR